MKKNNISIKYEKKNLIVGILLIVLGIISPILLNVHNFGVYDLLFDSLNHRDKGLLLIAAIRLVLLNSFRGLPHYLGAFVIVESTDLSINGKRVPHFKGLFALVIIPLVYSIINTAHNIKYDLGVPAFIVIFAIMYLEKLDYSKISLLKKTFIIILLLFGVQWLDVIPGLSILNFGRGETSQDIKEVAQIIGANDIITLFATMLTVIFTINGVLVAKLINDEQRILISTEKNKMVERELHDARIKALEARNYIELKNLVHDLKTPLTSIQGLVSVLMMMDDASNPKTKLYLEEAENSIDMLSEMISEILYEDKKIIISTEELMNYVFSHISHLPLSSLIRYDNNVLNANVQVNKIRFTRAIINALDNSYNSVDKHNGGIHIVITADEENVYFEVIDNGIGFKSEFMEDIVTRGFSIRKSTGLGLAFIKDVVDLHDGKIEINSQYGVGTNIKITISKVISNE